MTPWEDGSPPTNPEGFWRATLALLIAVSFWLTVVSFGCLVAWVFGWYVP